LQLTCDPLGTLLKRTECHISASEVMFLMQNWPRLETISAKLDSDHPLYGRESLVKASPATGCCPALRKFSAYDGVLMSRHLSILAEISPRLEWLSITVHIDSTVGINLQRCLQVWSSSLKHLYIFEAPSSFGKYPSAFSIIQSPLVELLDLWVSSFVIPPSALIHLPKLEKLNYKGEYSDVFELARLIQGGELPCLHDVDVGFSRLLNAPNQSNDELCIEATKALRKACKGRCIDVRVPFPESLDNDWGETDSESAVEGNHFNSSLGTVNEGNGDGL